MSLNSINSKQICYGLVHFNQYLKVQYCSGFPCNPTFLIDFLPEIIVKSVFKMNGTI